MNLQLKPYMVQATSKVEFTLSLFLIELEQLAKKQKYSISSFLMFVKSGASSTFSWICLLSVLTFKGVVRNICQGVICNKYGYEKIRNFNALIDRNVINKIMTSRMYVEEAKAWVLPPPPKKKQTLNCFTFLGAFYSIFAYCYRTL